MMHRVGWWVVGMASACVRLPEVVKVDGSIPHDALVYALPAKRVVVSLTAVKKTYDGKAAVCEAYLPGGSAHGGLSAADKALFAELGLKPLTYKGPRFTLTKAAWSTVSVPDKTNVYQVKVGGDEGSSAEALSLAWTPAGLLTSSTYSAEDRTASYVTSALELGASLVGAVLGAGGEKAVGDVGEVEHCKALASQYLALPSKILALRGSLDDASTQAVLEFKEAKLMEDQLGVKRAFTGEKAVTGTIVCDVGVDEAATGRAILAYFDVRGPSNVEKDACHIPPQLAFSEKEASYTLAAGETQTAAMTSGRAVTLNVELASWRPDVGGAGGKVYGHSYAYRRPVPASVWVETRVGGRTIAPSSDRRTEWFPQLGSVGHVPRYRAAKVEGAVTLDPETGALVGLSLSREPADLSGAGASIGSVVGALADAFRPKTELEARTEEHALLEALVAIEAARAQLDAAATP